MKKLINTILAAAAVFGLFACTQPEPETPKAPATVFEIDDLEALPADAGTFSVGINTNVAFTVSVPSDVSWLRYVETKAAEQTAPATRKTVTFEIDLNEADAMRQARVSFLDSAGEVLKIFTVIQKAGGGIQFEIGTPPDASVAGEIITLDVTSNVPFDVVPEVDWITVNSKTQTSIELMVDSNGTTEARDGVVNFFREGTDKLIGTVTIHQMEPDIIIKSPDGTSGYQSVIVANLAYMALTSGPAEITFAKGTHEGDFVLQSGSVPVTITGNGVATLDGTIEINGVQATIKDLSIAPSKEGALPIFETSYNYQHGIFVHKAGYGLRIENVKIDMSNLASDATGIFLLSEGEKGTQTDIIRGSTIDGGASGHRLMQAYGAKASITGNTFVNPYSSYAVRIGESGGDVLVSGNTFTGTPSCGVHFHNLKNSTITLGNGSKDTNKFGEIATPYKANSDVTGDGNTFAPPVTYSDEVVSIVVDPNAPATLSRVWGKYNGSTGAWDDEITDCSNWNRNGIISGDYVYVPICGNEEGKYGVAVFDLYTGDYIRTITNGFTKEGRFWTSGIVKMAGYDSDVIYVCNMAMGDSNQDLVVYRMIEPDSEGVPTKAEEAMRYTVPAGERYGDKMTSYGTDEDGLLMFVSFYDNTAAKTYRQEVEFRLTSGVINSTPDALSNALAGKGGALTGGVYILSAHNTGANSTRQALWANNFEMRFVVGWWWGNALDQWYNCRIDDNADWGSDPGSIFTNVGNYDSSCLDPRLAFIGGIRYLLYTVVEQDSDNRSSGYLRMVRTPDAAGTSAYGLLNAFWAVRDDASAFQRYPIGDTDDFLAVGSEGTNKTGFCDIEYKGENGEEVYVLSGITSTGMSVFKVD